MVYAILQNESVDDSLKRIIGEQIDLVTADFNEWESSISRFTKISTRVEKILAACDLVHKYAGPEFNDQINNLKKIQQNYTGIYQSTIHLKAFKYLKKVHPDWFKIHPCNKAENVLNDECKTVPTDIEYINEIVRETKTALENIRFVLENQHFENIDIQDIVTALESERRSLSQLYTLLRKQPKNQNAALLGNAITIYRLKIRLFSKLDPGYTKREKHTLKPLSKHLTMHTQLTPLRENFLEHPELYCSYAQILQLLGLIDRAKKELIAQIIPLGKVSFSNLKLNKTSKLAKSLNTQLLANPEF